MSDTDTKAPGEKTLHLATPKLSLKRPSEQNTVRQSFSHGRTKSVVVETKKRRVGPAVGKDAPNAAAAAAAPARRAPAASAAAPAQPQAATPAPAARPTGMVLRTLSDSERDARANALADARVREEEDRRHAEEESKRRAEREARDARERAAAEARKRDEEERRHKEDERKRRAEDEARRRLGEEPLPARGPLGPRPAAGDARRPQSLNHMARPAPSAADPASARPAATGLRAPGRPVQAEDEAEGKRIIRRPGMPTRIITPPKTPRAPGGNRNRGRLTIATATGGEDERTRSLASFRRRMQRLTGNRAAEPKEKLAREVIVPETITIQELANRMSERAVDVIRLLMKQGQLLKITDAIDADTAQLVAEELGHTVKRVAESDVEEGLFDTPDVDETIEPRPPVVTIMGHVDHGKTSLLDADPQDQRRLRRGRRHHPAYRRLSGDLASRRQDHLHRHAGPRRLHGDAGARRQGDRHRRAGRRRRRRRHAADGRGDLARQGRQGPADRRDQQDRQARGRPAAGADRAPAATRSWSSRSAATRSSSRSRRRPAMASTRCSRACSSRPRSSTSGRTATARPRAPSSRRSSTAAAGRSRPCSSSAARCAPATSSSPAPSGAASGRSSTTRARCRRRPAPSVPVEVLGFNGTPEAGDRVAVVESEARAREVTDYRTRQKRERSAARTSGARGSLADMMRDLKEGAGRKEFALVVKADVQGSVEAIVGALEKVGNEEVQARVIHSGVGGITESDITLAGASGAAVIGFNVRAHKEAREAAEQAGIEIRYYNIIYNLVDDVKAAMSGMLAPTLREERLGEAQVLEVFNVSKVGKVAGCRVLDGVVQRGAHVRLIRDNVVIHEGKLSQLKRFKDDAREVTAGQECGMAFENYQDMRQGDVIECYNVTEVRRTL